MPVEQSIIDNIVEESGQAPSFAAAYMRLKKVTMVLVKSYSYDRERLSDRNNSIFFLQCSVDVGVNQEENHQHSHPSWYNFWFDKV